MIFSSKHSRTGTFTLLIDTGAAVSLLKIKNLNPNHKTEFKSSVQINLKGITDELTPALGLASIYLDAGDQNFHHYFHLTNNENLPVDGILGSDFLTKNKAIIDFGTNKITFTRHQILNINHFNNQRKEEIKKILKLGNLPNNEKIIIEKILEKYNGIIKLENDEPGCSHIIEHEIKLKDEIPVKTKIYPLPKRLEDEASSQIKELLKNNVIRKSKSPYNSPVWIVDKKIDNSGIKKYRLVIDYRKLNEKTIANNYPIPRMDQILSSLGSNSYFTTLDLASGFHQIQVRQNDIPKTAFTVGNGHFEFVRMPFGLINAPATFQTLMNEIFQQQIAEKKCLVYLDDLIILGQNLTEHTKNLNEILSILEKNNLKINPDKCEFLQKELKYLGHVITLDGTKPQVEKIEKIINIKEPKTVKQIQSFLGLTGYYRKYIQNYGQIAKPLTKLLKKDTKFNFDSNCKTAFEILKQSITSAPILKYPNDDKKFAITTDASKEALGGVLTQEYDGHDMPIAYYSYTLNKAERNYSTIELECLAIIKTIKKFHHFLYGKEFDIKTDHRPLVWLHSVSDPTSRLVRWRLKIMNYQYKISYIPGKTNHTADLLSRPVLLALTNGVKSYRNFEKFNKNNNSDIRQNDNLRNIEDIKISLFIIDRNLNKLEQNVTAYLLTKFDETDIEDANIGQVLRNENENSTTLVLIIDPKMDDKTKTKILYESLTEIAMCNTTLLTVVKTQQLICDERILKNLLHYNFEDLVETTESNFVNFQPLISDEDIQNFLDQEIQNLSNNPNPSG